MRIMFGVAYLVVLLSIVGILSKSPDLLWFCFCLGIFWVAIGFIGWGVFLPTGKLIQDVCPMLPMLGENNSNADKLLPIVCPQPPSVRYVGSLVSTRHVMQILSPNMPGRADILNVIHECLDSRRGDLLILYAHHDL
jgi:hypothetical protein